MKNHKLFYGSSYDRGLDILLKLYPRILQKHSDVQLHCCYGWDLFDKGYANNPERMNWKQRIEEAMKQPGITHHGRVGKEELSKIRKECGIWVYPTYFPEINCITALECQRDGLVPVTMDFAALKETVGSGIKIEGDIYEENVQEAWIQALFKLMDEHALWEQESQKAREFAKEYSWDETARRWAENFT